MKLNPYLGFDGNCAEAFRFYQELLGGELKVLTHAGSPMADEVPPEWADRVMHSCLTAGDVVLMGGDTPPGSYAAPSGFCVSLHLPDAAEGERIFNALATEGNVTMPFEKTFWAERFGMVTDRFGTPWIVNCDPSAA